MMTSNDGRVRGRSGWVCGAVVVVLALAVGCGPTTTHSGNNNGGSGYDAGGSQYDSTVGTDAWYGSDAVADAANCGAQTEEIEIINLGDPPDLLIVMDRSGSMMLPPGIIPVGTSKWDIMKTALSTVMAAREANIRFGLSVFPTDNDCSVDPGVRVPMDLFNAASVMAYLNGTSPNGNTPAHFGLQEALLAYQSIPVNPAGRYVLFATDGIPNCGGNPPNVDIETPTETVAAVTALANAGIHTFVLGFGGILGLDPQVLNDSAVAGLEPVAGGPPYFYHADDAASLQAALDTIAGGIIVPSCSYELTTLPPVPEDVAVYFDGVAVPRNPTQQDGWDYHPDNSTITFFGSYCTQLMSGQVSEVDFIFGCPGPVVY